MSIKQVWVIKGFRGSVLGVCLTEKEAQYVVENNADFSHECVEVYSMPSVFDSKPAEESASVAEEVAANSAPVVLSQSPYEQGQENASKSCYWGWCYNRDLRAQATVEDAVSFYNGYRDGLADKYALARPVQLKVCDVASISSLLLDAA